MLWALFLLGVFLHQSYALIRSYTRTPIEKSRAGDVSRCPFLARLQQSKRLATLSDRVIETKTSRSHSDAEPMPWKRSITPTREMPYMPMMEHQLEVLEQLGMIPVELEREFTVRQSTVKDARIGSMCFQNEKFRKVRLTYFDAGDAVQVFNAVWYPHYQYDAPIFGLDMISIGQNRIINVVDFQPLDNTPQYNELYINHLTSIREKYPDLHDSLTGKIYTNPEFFSKNMLFSRSTNENKVQNIVVPAYKEYLDSYIKMLNNIKPNHCNEKIASVYQRQSDYDAYNVIKDPAIGIFNAYFGKEWSHDFIHNFMFSNYKDGKVYPKDTNLSPTGTTISSGSNTSDGISTQEKQYVIGMNKPVHSFKFNDKNEMVFDTATTATSIATPAS